MPMDNTQPVNALTCTFNGLVNVISTPITVADFMDRTTTDQAYGIWDTGAMHSCITRDLAHRLHLSVVGFVSVSGVHGVKDNVPVYFVRLTLNNQDIWLDIQVTECERLSDPSDNVQMLIGMDVIGKGDFAISNHAGRTVMTYRKPSVATTDYVAELGR